MGLDQEGMALLVLDCTATDSWKDSIPSKVQEKDELDCVWNHHSPGKESSSCTSPRDRFGTVMTEPVQHGDFRASPRYGAFEIAALSRIFLYLYLCLAPYVEN